MFQFPPPKAGVKRIAAREYRNTSIIAVIVATKNTRIIESAVIRINNASKICDHCQGFFKSVNKCYI
jgi:hypothetical protein